MMMMMMMTTTMMMMMMMMILLVISNPSRKCESQFESSQGLKTKKCLKPLSGLDVNIDSNSRCPPSFSPLKLPQKVG